MNIIANTRQVGGVTIVGMSGQIVLGDESAALGGLVRDLLGAGYMASPEFITLVP
jgi:hypothetical protein